MRYCKKLLLLAISSLCFGGCDKSTEKWPGDLIEEKLSLLVGETETVVPPFDAESYVVNYYEDYKAIAINGFGFESNIVTTYKTSLEENNWEITGYSDHYQAISPFEDVRLDFYIDELNNNFSVDLFKYQKPSEEWPVDDINELINYLAAVGYVLPYNGEATGYLTDNDYTPPIIKCFVETGTEQDGADSYNEALVDAGYLEVGKVYGEPVYAQLNTTLGMRAAFLTEGVVTIELFNINII